MKNNIYYNPHHHEIAIRTPSKIDRYTTYYFPQTLSFPVILSCCLEELPHYEEYVLINRSYAHTSILLTTACLIEPPIPYHQERIRGVKHPWVANRAVDPPSRNKARNLSPSASFPNQAPHRRSRHTWNSKHGALGIRWPLALSNQSIGVSYGM